MSMLTDYHAQYYAYELTRRYPADRMEKLSQSIFNATVDLNPHQIDAALFAFRSLLSRGAILANEGVFGATIEAGRSSVRSEPKLDNAMRMRPDEEQGRIDQRKEELISEVEARLKQRTSVKDLSAIKWRVV